MYALLGQMNFGAITSPLYSSASRLSQPPVGSCLMDCPFSGGRACSGLQSLGQQPRIESRRSACHLGNRS